MSRRYLAPERGHMSDKNNPQRLERIANETEDEQAKEALFIAAKEIARVRDRLKDGHQEREALRGTITGMSLSNRELTARINRLMDLAVI